MAKSFKPAYLSLISIDPEFEAHLDALDEGAQLAAAANEPECPFDEIVELIRGQRRIPFCTNMSAETAYRLTQHLARAA